MPSRKLVEITVRCIAVFALVPIVDALANTLSIALDTGPIQGQILLVNGSGILVRLLLAALLWIFAPELGRWIAPQGEAPRAAFGVAEIAPLAIGLVGLAIAVSAVGAIAVAVAELSIPSPVLGAMASQGVGGLWGGLVQLLAGVAVLAGRKALGRAFLALRRAE